MNRLPPEVLSHIIQYIPKGYARDTNLIIPMTHVCRYWRNSIISSPENWTRISSQRIGIAKLSLERCRTRSVELWLDLRQVGITPGFFDLITPHLQKTRVLGVDSPFMKKEFYPTLQKILPLTPNLRSLSLNGGIGSCIFGRPKDPCGQLTPSLTHLDLSNTPFYPSFLRLRTLTSLRIHRPPFGLHLDPLLDFLEENRALEYAVLNIRFDASSLQNTRYRDLIENRLRRLSITSDNAVDIDGLLSKIAVQEGAHLEVCLYARDAGLEPICSLVSLGHLSNLRSPTFMEYSPNEGSLKTIRLLGPNGSFLLKRTAEKEPSFVEFPLLPLDEIRTFYLKHSLWGIGRPRSVPTTFPPSSFPALETLVIERVTHISFLLSTLFSDPSSSPQLKTLAFLGCEIDDGFVEELTQFSSCRKDAWIHCVVIVDSGCQLPRVALIDELRKHVPIVDVRVGKELPFDLKWDGG